MDHSETPDELEFVDGTDDVYTPEELQRLRAQALDQFALPELAAAAEAAESAATPEPAAPRSAPAPDLEAEIAPWLTPRVAPVLPKLSGAGSRKGRKLAKPDADRRGQLTPEQRLLILDAWQRSGLPAKDFAALVGLSKHTLYAWKKKFADHGPAGLMDRKRGARSGSRLPELTKRAILMIKEAQPDAGCQRISDLLARGPALPASPNAVAKVLKEAGYVMQEESTRRHPDKKRVFEDTTCNQLWQTDLFTFILKRQNRRVHLVVFLDDHSRYITAWGLSGSASTTLVLDALRDGLASYPPPQTILTDNGSQYVTWRGTSQFTKEMRKRGIEHRIARPRRPQTLGKVERFWGSLWRECLHAAVFRDLDDARVRLGHFIDHYNFRRPHRGIDGLVPADRYFKAAAAIQHSMDQRIADNALDLARHGPRKEPFYLTGRTGDGEAFSIHSEGDRLYRLDADGTRHELEASAPEPVEPPPGYSPLDDVLGGLAAALEAPPKDRDADDTAAADDADDAGEADDTDATDVGDDVEVTDAP